MVLTANYTEEPSVFISSASLNLKPFKRTQSLDRNDLMENLTFEWHTNVTTPPNTPIVPVQQISTQASSNQCIPQPSRDLFLPAFTFDEQDNLPTKVDKFMASERYHSQYQQAMTKKITNL